VSWPERARRVWRLRTFVLGQAEATDGRHITDDCVRPMWVTKPQQQQISSLIATGSPCDVQRNCRDSIHQTHQIHHNRSKERPRFNHTAPPGKSNARCSPEARAQVHTADREKHYGKKREAKHGQLDRTDGRGSPHRSSGRNLQVAARARAWLPKMVVSSPIAWVSSPNRCDCRRPRLSLGWRRRCYGCAGSGTRMPN
jgi:hypothetical protein